MRGVAFPIALFVGVVVRFGCLVGPARLRHRMDGEFEGVFGPGQPDFLATGAAQRAARPAAAIGWLPNSRASSGRASQISLQRAQRTERPASPSEAGLMP